MSFVGGKLKLKGGETLKPAGGVKKKKKKSSPGPGDETGASTALARVDSKDDPESNAKKEAEDKEDLKKVLHGYELKSPSENEDRRTEAEKRFEQRQMQLEQDRLKKLASKSHRDRVKDFNDYLSNLSEHHDIPRVGPG